MRWSLRCATWCGAFVLCVVTLPRAQDGLVVRPGPPPHDDFETDADGDGIPDGWYNLRDATLESTGGHDGPRFLKFTNARPGRPARASRAFGVDGRQYEAMNIGLWVRIDDVVSGERLGEDPSLLLDMLDEGLVPVGRGNVGPWTRGRLEPGKWHSVSNHVTVPPSCRDVIMSVGLLGAIGALSIDGLSIELVPVGGVPTTNLVLNGACELGDNRADHWLLHNGAKRVSPGYESGGAIELGTSGARAQAPLAVPVNGLGELSFSCMARGQGLRSSGGATGVVFFLDDSGKTLAGSSSGARLFRLESTFAWKSVAATARVPAGAVRAVVQFEKLDATGTAWVDDLVVTTQPDPTRGRWTPDHNATDRRGWHPYEPADAIAPGSALDACGLVAPSIRQQVSIRDGRFQRGDARARFFGVVALPPLGVVDAARADAMADRLARSGVNLVRFDDLDAPLGPSRSLLDDTADNTTALDPEMLVRFDHLVAALKKRGISISLSLTGSRRLREGDGVSGGPALPAGGGPAIGFDPKAADMLVRFADALLSHVNQETGLALRDDPVLAWVTLSGEQSLFNLVDDPGLLPPQSEAVLREVSRSLGARSGRPLWQRLESAQWQSLASRLRDGGIKVPLAACAHWRDEPEFVAGLLAPGLDVVDDRLYPAPLPFAAAERHSLVWDRNGGLLHEAASKHRGDRPYVASQWCEHTSGLWAFPLEGASMLLAAEQAAREDWDALVRRGIFLHPKQWGAGPPGTQGGEDTFLMVEALNANPAVFAMLPHAASVFYRFKAGRSKASEHRGALWDPAGGRLVIDTAHTHALVVQADRRPARFATLSIECETPGGTVAVSSLGSEPIASANRLLVTAVGRIEPTGMTYADACRTAPGVAGRPPLLCEPVVARVTWNTTATVHAYRLDNAGNRAGELTLETTRDGVVLSIDGSQPGLHFELTTGN